ncbi:MAG: tyrosine-type recombinase/integrase [Acidocella sp.]|nr:tyrosine-type recombinase/integrase [Acidocella sp.]
MLLALHTGQRLGDILTLPWSAYDGRAITVSAQSKTGARVVVPVRPELRTALDATERRAVVICTRRDGHAWKSDHFKKSFAAARDALGLPDDLHFHGLRHSAAVRLAEAGCSPHEIAAVTGHKSLSMVSRYTDQARQETLATTAIARLENKTRR